MPPTIDPPVTVVPTRYVAGGASGDLLPLSEALRRPYATGALLCHHDAGRRATKADTDDPGIKAHVLFADLDFPRHRDDSWTAPPEPWFGNLVTFLADTPAGHQTGWYPTPGGARLFWILPEPLPVRHVRAWMSQWRDELASHGVHIDGACLDWPHLFTAPYARRDEPFDMSESVLGINFTPGPLTAWSPPASLWAETAAKRATVKPRDPAQPLPEPDWSLLPDTLREVLEPPCEALADVHERHETTFRIAGAVASIVRRPGEPLDLALVEAYLAPSYLAMCGAFGDSSYDKLIDTVIPYIASCEQAKADSERALLDAADSVPDPISATDLDRLLPDPAVLEVLDCPTPTKTRPNPPPRAHSSNVLRVLRNDPRMRDQLYLDERSLFVQVENPEDAPLRRAILSTETGPVLTDSDAGCLRIWLCDAYRLQPSVADLHEGIKAAAQLARRNPLRDEIDSFTWDGESRVDTWLHKYAGVEDTVLTRAFARRFLVSAIARLYKPGCQVDTVLILRGAQGARKSTLFRELAGEDNFSDTRLDLGNKDAYLALHSTWIYELAELESLRGRAADAVKGFLSSRVDNFRAPYGRLIEPHPRKMVFVGTCNPEDILTDWTGSRRFWPVHTADSIDVEGLKAVREQLWAEARTLFELGEQWWLTREEDALRGYASDDFTAEDTIASTIAEWLVRDAATIPERLTLTTVMERALRLTPDKFEANKLHAAAALKSLGFEQVRVRSGGKRIRLWVRQQQQQEQDTDENRKS